MSPIQFPSARAHNIQNRLVSNHVQVVNFNSTFTTGQSIFDKAVIFPNNKAYWKRKQ